MFEFLKSDKNNNKNQSLSRIDFESKDQWSDLLDLSQKQHVYIFKHSSRCGVSSMVLRRFEKQVQERKETYVYLHIQGFRSISNWIEEELGIRHESPQLIVLKNSKVLAHDSHYALLEIIPKIQ